MLTIILNTTRHELQAIITEKTPDTVCIWEYAPKNYTTATQESELYQPGYDVLTNVPKMKRGILICVRNEFQALSSEVTDFCLADES